MYLALDQKVLLHLALCGRINIRIIVCNRTFETHAWWRFFGRKNNHSFPAGKRLEKSEPRSPSITPIKTANGRRWVFSQTRGFSVSEVLARPEISLKKTKTMQLCTFKIRMCYYLYACTRRFPKNTYYFSGKKQTLSGFKKTAVLHAYGCSSAERIWYYGVHSIIQYIMSSIL